MANRLVADVSDTGDVFQAGCEPGLGVALRANYKTGIFGMGGDAELVPEGDVLSKKIFEMELFTKFPISVIAGFCSYDFRAWSNSRFTCYCQALKSWNLSN